MSNTDRNKKIDVCLIELTDAIKALNIEGYEKDTIIKWKDGSLVIHMFGEFAKTFNPAIFESLKNNPA